MEQVVGAGMGGVVESGWQCPLRVYDRAWDEYPVAVGIGSVVGTGKAIECGSGMMEWEDVFGETPPLWTQGLILLACGLTHCGYVVLV